MVTFVMESTTWDPDSTSFPSIQDLPTIPGAPKYASWFWGQNDYIGRLNLLTPTRIKAASSEIRTGELARTDLPLNVPQVPAFGRQEFRHHISPLRKDLAYDDLYSLNMQSGTQWDGFRHVAHHETGYFYNWVKGSDIDGTEPNAKDSIHYWSEHGFAGRGVLLDYRSYANAKGIRYSSATGHAISYAELVEVGKHQGLDIRPSSQGGDIQIGDILFVRAGFVEDYYNRTREANESISKREFAMQGDDDKIQAWAGLKQEVAIRDWLHDCYFSAVAGDSPTFEVFSPPADGSGLHAYILACWGMPLGKMVDLEKVAELEMDILLYQRSG